MRWAVTTAVLVSAFGPGRGVPCWLVCWASGTLRLLGAPGCVLQTEIYKPNFKITKRGSDPRAAACQLSAGRHGGGRTAGHPDAARLRDTTDVTFRRICAATPRPGWRDAVVDGLRRPMLHLSSGLQEALRLLDVLPPPLLTALRVFGSGCFAFLHVPDVCFTALPVVPCLL